MRSRFSDLVARGLNKSAKFVEARFAGSIVNAIKLDADEDCMFEKVD
jgi:hypothetical protein